MGLKALESTTILLTFRIQKHQGVYGSPVLQPIGQRGPSTGPAPLNLHICHKISFKTGVMGPTLQILIWVFTQSAYMLLSTRSAVTFPAMQHRSLWLVSNYTRWWQRHNVGTTCPALWRCWESKLWPYNSETVIPTTTCYYLLTVNHVHW